MLRRHGLTAAALLLAAALPLHAATWHVDDDAPFDPAPGDPNFGDPFEDGSPEHPFDAIQEAIDASSDGDEVLLADGTYTGVGNRDLDYGGRAIAVRGASGNREDCVIDCEGKGRALHLHSGEDPNSVLADLSIINGYASERGGGVYVYQSGLTISNCDISRCTAAWGGGVYTHGELRVSQSVFSLNTGWAEGGAISAWGTSARLERCKFIRNGSKEGGGLFLSFLDHVAIDNCLFSENTANIGGGFSGLACYVIEIEGCTFHKNVAMNRGGAFSEVRCQTTCRNSIISASGPDAIWRYRVTCESSIIENGTVERYFGTGCIDVDPKLTADGYLTAESPAIDAGDPNTVGSGSTDIHGEPRVLGGRVDMGADEWLDGDDDALPNWWELQHYDDTTSGLPGEDEDGDRRDTLTEFVAGKDPHRARQEYHVSNAGNDAWDGHAPSWDGVHGPKATIQAAIDLCHPSEGDTVTVADGVYRGVENRDLAFDGRVMKLRGASGDPRRCVIDCERLDVGMNFNVQERADTVIEGLAITNGGNAGVSIGLASPTLTDCLIAGCVDVGVAAWASASTLRGCAIVNNGRDDAYGGGFSGSWAGPTLINCTIAGNRAATNATRRSALTLDGSIGGVIGCVIWGDDAQPCSEIGGNYEPIVAYSNIKGSATWTGDLPGVIDADPLFVDADGPDDDPNTWEDNDYRLAAGSPCIDAGDPNYVPLAGATDIAGLLRVWDGDGDGVARVDMGAYEFGSSPHGDLNCDGRVDTYDIDPFVLALADPAGYAAAYPACSRQLADADRDGRPDTYDIDAFVALLIGE